MDQQALKTLTDITTITTEEVKDFATVKDDGSFEDLPMNHHLHMFKGFLLYYQYLCQEYSSTLDENDVLSITKTCFQECCGSPEYHEDVANDANPF
jgi:hypothetical protein